MFKIEKYANLPSNYKGRPKGSGKYPFHRLKKGEMFFVPLAGGEKAKVRARITSALAYARKSNNKLDDLTVRQTTRRGENGIGVYYV